MDFFSIFPHIHIFDLSLIALFLVGTLIAGFRHNSRSFTDFAVGDKKFSNFAQVSTIVATYMCGSTLYNLFSKTYQHGFIFFFISLGNCIGLIFVGIVLIPKMGRFLKDKSISESIANIYGKEARIFASVTSILISIGSIAAQFKIFSLIGEYLTGINPFIITCFSAALITFYSATGGIKSVTYTDIVQFVAFSFAIPVIGIFIGDKIDIADTLSNFSDFSLQEIFFHSDLDSLSMISLFVYLTIPALNPATYQRILISSNLHTLRTNFIISAFIMITLKALIALIPLFLYLDNPNLNPNELVKYILNEYTGTVTKGLLIVGIMSMAMSTADSHLNAASVIFSNDLILRKTTDRKKLLSAKAFSIFIGLTAMILAITKQDVLDIIISTTSYYMTTVTPVMLSAILGFRTKKQFVLISMSLAALFVLIIFFINSGSVASEYLILGMIINFTIFFSLHYLFKPEGLGWIKEKNPLPQATKANNKKRFSFNLLQVCMHNAPKKEKYYIFLGIYIIVYGFVTMYTQISLLSQYNSQMLMIYAITAGIGTSLLFFPAWSQSRYAKEISSILWFVSIFATLFIINAIWGFLNNFQGLQAFALAVNLFVAFFILGWRVSIIFSIVGFLSAGKICEVFFDSHFIGGSLLPISYVLGFIIILTLIFIAPYQRKAKSTKQKLVTTRKRLEILVEQLKEISDLEKITSVQKQEISRLKRIKEEFLENIKSHTKSSIVGISSIAEALYDDLFYYADDTDEEAKNQILQIITDAKNTLLNIENIIVDSEVSSYSYVLQKKDISLEKLIKKRIDICSTVYCAHIMENNNKEISFTLSSKEEILLTCDPLALGHVLDNLLVYAINNTENSIKIDISQTKSTIGINYMFVEPIETKQQFMNSFGYDVVKKILQLQNGDMEISTNKTQETIVKIILPKQPLPIQEEKNILASI